MKSGDQLLSDDQRIASQRSMHALHGSEEIHHQRDRRSLRVLEQERWAFFTNNALCNFGDFEFGIYLDTHALELPMLF